MEIIPYGTQSITDADIEAVVQVLKSSNLTQGPAVDQFENDFSKYLGCQYSVAVTNGTAALHLAALALGVRPGDKVLVTSNSFVASANCIRYCGGDVEFVDIDSINHCIDIDLLEKKIKSQPRGTYKGIVAVDFAGFPVDLERISNLAKQNGLWLLEDACHALGGAFLDSKNQWQKCGNGQFADVSVFSFHPVKHLATGEGGMITTNSDTLNKKLRVLRTHGIEKNPSLLSANDGPWYYEMQELGFNYRISDVLCALGSSQLKRIEANLQRRQEIANRYEQEFKQVSGLEIPGVSDRQKHAYHLYVIRTQKRAQLFQYLKEQKIYAQVHYIPIYRQPYYQSIYGEQHLPEMDKYYSQCLSLPMFHSMTDSQQARVIDTVKKFMAAH